MDALVPVALVHRYATVWPASRLTASILLAAAVVAVLCGLLRARGDVGRWLPGAIYVAAGALLLRPFPLTIVPPWLPTVAILVAAIALTLHLVMRRREMLTEAADSALDGQGRGPAYWIYIGVALVVAALVMLHDLGGYSGLLLTWESAVIAGFAEAADVGQSVLAYLGPRFLWDNGVVSGGNTSLFYGWPTYLLFQLAGYSTWTLRILSVVATLLSIWMIAVLGRRFFGSLTGAAAAVLLALNAAVLFYGRYGSSPAGTLLAVILALLATWYFLSAERPPWWSSFACAAALYVATLQYSPARVVVMLLLALIGVVVVLQWRLLRWSRALGCLVIIAAAIGVWEVQKAYNVTQLLFFARGEQYLHFIQHRDYLREYLGRTVDPLDVTLVDKIELLYRLLQTTIPQYLNLIGLRGRQFPPGAVMTYDPPPLDLYFAPAALFIVWGVLISIARLPAWRYAFLLVWFVLGSVPLLLTNRVDSHRAFLFVIPLTLWSAFGVREAAGVLRAARVPAALQHLAAAALMVTAAYFAINMLNYPNKPPTMSIGPVLASEVEAVPGPVLVGSNWDHREVGWAQLMMLERNRRQPERFARMMDPGLLNGIKDESEGPAEIHVRSLRRLLSTDSILVGPAERFQRITAALQEGGARAVERRTGRFALLRFDGGEAATGIPDSTLVPLPTVFIPPTPTPMPLNEGPQVMVTDLKPIKEEYGFAPAVIDAAFGGGPIAIGGRRYPRGIGMHAWTRMTYAVPPNAFAFQAVVGLSDSVKDCEAAMVSFELRGDDDKILSKTDLVDTTTGPLSVYADLTGVHQLTLAVTEGGNGRDCDHANWGRPAFLTRVP